jgi:hypothetical protein
MKNDLAAEHRVNERQRINASIEDNKLMFLIRVPSYVTFDDFVDDIGANVMIQIERNFLHLIEVTAAKIEQRFDAEFRKHYWQSLAQRLCRS